MIRLRMESIDLLSGIITWNVPSRSEAMRRFLCGESDHLKDTLLIDETAIDIMSERYVIDFNFRDNRDARGKGAIEFIAQYHPYNHEPWLFFVENDSTALTRKQFVDILRKEFGDRFSEIAV